MFYIVMVKHALIFFCGLQENGVRRDYGKGRFRHGGGVSET